MKKATPGGAAGTSSVSPVVMGKIQTDIAVLQIQMTEQQKCSEQLTGWSEVLYKASRNMHTQLSFMAAKSTRNDLVLGGVHQVRGENPVEQAMEFLRDKVRISVNPQDVISAYRLNGQPRGYVNGIQVQFPQLMMLKATPNLKRKILQNAKNLKGQEDPQLHY